MRADARRNRDAVLEAAIRLLANRPAASMQDVADASGVGRTTVYRHFPNRDDLIRALSGRVADEAQELSAAAIADDAPVLETLRHLATRIVGLGWRYRFLQAQPGADEEVRARLESSDATFQAWLESAQQRGELRDDLPAAWMLAAIRQLSVAAVDTSETLGRETAGELLGETIVAAFAPRG